MVAVQGEERNIFANIIIALWANIGKLLVATQT